MPTATGITKFVMDCSCYPLYAVLGHTENEFSGAMAELKFQSKKGYAEVMNIQLLHLTNDTTIMSNFPDLQAHLPHLKVHERSYGSSNLKWIMFNCELETRSSPSDEKGMKAPRWLDLYVAKMNTGKEIKLIEGSPIRKRMELQTARNAVAVQERVLKEMVEKEKAQQEQNEGEKSAKKTRKTAETSHSFRDKEYPLPSSQVPISRNLYKKLLDNKLGENEVAV